MNQEPPLSESEQLQADTFQRKINFELLRAKSHHEDTGYLPIPYFVHISDPSSQTEPEEYCTTKFSFMAGIMRVFHRIKKKVFGEF